MKLIALKTNPTLLAGFLVHEEMSLKTVIESNHEDNGSEIWANIIIHMLWSLGCPASDIELMLEL